MLNFFKNFIKKYLIRKDNFFFLLFAVISIIIIILILYIFFNFLFYKLNTDKKLFAEATIWTYPLSAFDNKVKDFTKKKCKIVNLKKGFIILKYFKNYPYYVNVCENLKEKSYSNIFGLLQLRKEE